MEKYYKRMPNLDVLNKWKENKVLMKPVVDSIRLFLRRGWACESIETAEDIWGIKIDTADELGMLSSNRSRFVEILNLLAEGNKTVEDALMEDVSKNNQKLTSQSVQREIVRICAKETVNSISTEVGDSNFSLILDSWTGITWHQNVSVVVRFVNKTGAVIERFLGIVHVPEEDTDAQSLGRVIEKYLREAGIQLEKLRCYSYNGASSLCELLSRLRGVFLEEHKRAYYSHCLSHRFQLRVVTVGKYNCETYELFQFIDGLCGFLKDMPVKLKDPLRKEEMAKIMKSVSATSVVFTSDELVYYDAIVGLITDYSRVIELLYFTRDFGSSRGQKYESGRLLKLADTFEFALCLHLMRDIIGLTNEMSQLLQKRETEIEKAMSLVAVVNQKLADLKEHGWDPLFSEVSAFCEKNEIEVPDMVSIYDVKFSGRQKGEKITNLQYYHDNLFLSVLEDEMKEINEQFNEGNVNLILCVAAMNPKNSFSSFKKDKMVRFAKYFPCDFLPEEIDMLDNELDKYIIDMRSSPDFKDLDGIVKLAEKLVEMQRVQQYPSVYRVIELALTLPIVAPAIERVVSSGEVVKEWISKRVGNEWVNDCLVAYIEQDIFTGIANEVIIDRFESSTDQH